MQRLDKTFKSKSSENPNNWNFTTKDVEATIFNLEKYNPNYLVGVHEVPKFDVNWHIQPQLEEFGVKGMDIVIDGVTGIFHYSLYDKNTHDIIEKSKDTLMSINEFQWTYNITNNVKGFDEAVYVTALDFNAGNMVCDVTFG